MNNGWIRLAEISARPHTINVMPKTSILALVFGFAVHSVGIHWDKSGFRECPIQAPVLALSLCRPVPAADATHVA
jgi:hypothetical protein